MSSTVAIVDLGLGNLRSVAWALSRAGGRPVFVSDPDSVRSTSRIVVPGQGAFGDGVDALASGMGEALREVIQRGTPYLGICLGMQLLFESSEEAPDKPGLGCFEGVVRRFSAELRDPVDGRRLKIPHIGWNRVHGAHRLLPDEGWFYFAHSYHCAPADPGNVVGTVEYGQPVCAAVARDSVFACQFHPEKSHVDGRRLIERFLSA